MADRELPTGLATSAKTAAARSLAEQGLHEQAAGHLDEADRLLSQAQEYGSRCSRGGPARHDAGRAPARLQDLADQDVEESSAQDWPGRPEVAAAWRARLANPAISSVGLHFVL